MDDLHLKIKEEDPLDALLEVKVLEFLLRSKEDEIRALKDNIRVLKEENEKIREDLNDLYYRLGLF